MTRLEKLSKRIGDFLPALRLGIDFGEGAGGLALIKGTDIIHAETFVDFHEATMEQRRTLRRARRTRRAKKMRIARLRSWILRQEISSKIPGSEKNKKGKSRLPDPYKLMKEKKYQTLPGFYQVGGKKPDVWKHGAERWIDKARKGEVDAEGFVIALTHIFQKRGYKYDDKELADYTDSRLAEFLDSCCLLNEAPDMKKASEEEIGRREEESGKSIPKLRVAFGSALTRQPEARKALPRQIKENYLRQMIDEFGKRWKLDGKKIEDWKKELAGLLNKVVREARFDNRLKSGCSWCGKKTPRKHKPKVQQLTLEAAVANIRVYTGAQTRANRPLTEEEKKPWFDWFSKRQQNYKFGKGGKTPLFERAPTKANIEKALEAINAEKRWLKKKGKPYAGFPMLEQLNDIYNRKNPKGRTNLCIDCLKLAAQGKSMKDAGVEWQKLRIRRAPNPKREQHDARVLKRIEQLLFNKGKKGEDAWRVGPVSIITAEVPDPQTERVGKGEQTERKEFSLRERMHKETGGKCVYCEKEISVEEMEMEHIFPRSKGGPDIQINRVASCRKCNHPDTGKGGRLPSEWLSGEEWEKLKARVDKLASIPARKKEILLLGAGEDFPEDPTALAHTGARWRAFVAELHKLFEDYGVEPPALAYEKGKPLIQRVGGRWTRELRRSWLFKDNDAKEKNFPEKNRSDLFNHAQDAALLAATPPHTWRSQIILETALRPCVKRDKTGVMVRTADGKIEYELRPRPGVALLSLAPDWAGFIAKREKPIVRVMGKLKANWRKQLFKESFYKKPDIIEKTLAIHKPLDPPTDRQRRAIRETAAFGTQVQIPYYDRSSKTTRVRKVLLNEGVASESAIFWHDPKGRKGNFQISLKRPKAIHKFLCKRVHPPGEKCASLHPVDPAIPAGAVRLGILKRGEMIKLSADKNFPEGFYRVKELSDGGIIAIPENALTDALAQRLNIPKEERITPPERKLGKGDLQKLFSPKS